MIRTLRACRPERRRKRTAVTFSEAAAERNQAGMVLANKKGELKSLLHVLWHLSKQREQKQWWWRRSVRVVPPWTTRKQQLGTKASLCCWSCAVAAQTTLCRPHHHVAWVGLCVLCLEVPFVLAPCCLLFPLGSSPTPLFAAAPSLQHSGLTPFARPAPAVLPCLRLPRSR